MVAPKDIRSYYLGPMNVTIYDKIFTGVVKDPVVKDPEMILDYPGGS